MENTVQSPMNDTVIRRAKKITGVINLPGDKSISHRAALLSLLCREPVEVDNYSDSDDCQRSLDAVRQLGGAVEIDGQRVRLTPPAGGLVSPDGAIECGNSGTTMRLLAGLLSGSQVAACLTGDDSLSRRPMQRVVEPLRQMNAAIETSAAGTAPLDIRPGALIPLDYTLPVASAQVKSALLLAGLASGSNVTIREKVPTRDHTERMIAQLGGTITVEDITAEIMPDPIDPRKKIKSLPTQDYKRAIHLTASGPLTGGLIDIPGDISTAAFFIAAALMVPGSHLILKDIGVNSTRNAFINVLKQMGADVAIKNRHEISNEPHGDIEVRYSLLKPRKISGDLIPALIDEIPALAVLASRIEGTTIIRDAGELRHKESDRIASLVKNLSAMGVKVGEFPDGLAIEGSGELNGAEVDSGGDHRIAMAFAVAGLATHGNTVIKNSRAVDISCPRFFTLLESLRQ